MPANTISQHQPDILDVYMYNSSTEDRRRESKINDAMPTSEALSGRGGLSLFVRYLGIGILPHLERMFGSMSRDKKGSPSVRSSNNCFASS